MAEHHANEAMLDQIRSSDKWSFYQAKSIKANLFATKIELLQAMGKAVDEKDLSKVEEYRKEQETVKEEAEEKERASEAHLRHHTILSGSVTLFQIGIAVGAISVLTKRKSFWFGSLGFGVVGVVHFCGAFSSDKPARLRPHKRRRGELRTIDAPPAYTRGSFSGFTKTFCNS